jgi:hypothetical protein
VKAHIAASKANDSGDIYRVQPSALLSPDCEQVSVLIAKPACGKARPGQFKLLSAARRDQAYVALAL